MGKTKTQGLILAWANIAIEPLCECDYYQSAPRHRNPGDPAYHPLREKTYDALDELQRNSAREWIAADGKAPRR